MQRTLRVVRLLTPAATAHIPIEFCSVKITMAGMTASSYRVRRATVEDLGTLKALWESMRLPTHSLEKRLTEFQVAEDAGGKVVGTFGFQIHERQARIYGEAFGISRWPTAFVRSSGNASRPSR